MNAQPQPEYVTVENRRCPRCGRALTILPNYHPHTSTWAQCDVCRIAGKCSIGAWGIRSITFTVRK